MKYFIIGLLILGTGLIGAGVNGRHRATCAEERGAVGILIGLGVALDLTAAVFFIIWKLVTT